MNPEASANETAVLTPAATARFGKLLKRSEAARLLGVSVSTLRRREGEMLNPILGPDGVHLFDEAEVRAVMVTVRGRAALAALGTSAGDTAADVFTLLDDNVHPVEIVKRLRLTPDTVSTLHERWATMRGGFPVSPTEAAELGRIARARVPKTAAVAIAQIRVRVAALTRMRQGSATCHACGDKTASICETCVVSTRGPLGSLAVRVERRANEAGAKELRVAADVYWDGVGEAGSDIAELTSEWFCANDVGETPIADIVEHAERTPQQS
jgi:hypothetical protein